eukprot:3485063-Pyramimonas_sp.AAC.1
MELGLQKLEDRRVLPKSSFIFDVKLHHTAVDTSNVLTKTGTSNPGRCEEQVINKAATSNPLTVPRAGSITQPLRFRKHGV